MRGNIGIWKKVSHLQLHILWVFFVSRISELIRWLRYPTHTTYFLRPCPPWKCLWFEITIVAIHFRDEHKVARASSLLPTQWTYSVFSFWEGAPLHESTWPLNLRFRRSSRVIVILHFSNSIFYPLWYWVPSPTNGGYQTESYPFAFWLTYVEYFLFFTCQFVIIETIIKIPIKIFW